MTTMAMLETPSRVWRRIEAIEGRDMPSLPSLPPFENSAETDYDEYDGELELDEEPIHVPSPIHSTPAAAFAHSTIASTIRPTSSTSSTARFANSIASRSIKSSSGLSSPHGVSARGDHPDSFEISDIPSLPDVSAGPETAHYADEDETDEQSKDSVPDVYLPPEDHYEEDSEQDVSLTEALQSVSRTSSPPYPIESFENEATPKKKNYDSVSLKSEPKLSPFDKYRNVALRKTALRARTPSLSRTMSSQTSSPTHSTPQSKTSVALPQSPANAYSIPLPRSNTASPAVLTSHLQDGDEPSQISLNEADIRSMDITDLHITPPQPDNELENEELESKNGEYSVSRDQNNSEPEAEREPTFSSDGEPTSYTHDYRASGQIPSQPSGHLSNTSSSPAQSIALTPTPVFPRPRARFDLPSLNGEPDTHEQLQDQQSEQDYQEQDHEELMTPHTRRRSFLLSVINSTTRPRFKFPTPHPRNLNLATPSIAVSTPGPGIGSVTRTNLQTAFAGVTPRPRSGMGRNARASHPLSQATLASSPVTSESESNSPTSGLQGAATDQWAPIPASYDGTTDRASFISTASSHDLTTHHRINTSFDPAMGFGTGAGQGVGRFNAGKLNNYLHGLNRRLQEENEVLIERLRKAEEKKADPTSVGPAGSDIESGRRLSGGGRRVSAAGITLGNVIEDVGGEGWGEEKAELEGIVDALRGDVARYIHEREAVEKALEDEKEERARDKERWRERMAEVEQGVEAIVKDLEKRAELAENQVKDVEEESSQHVRSLEKQLAEIKAERDVVVSRAEKAEHMLESGKELGGELRNANERLGDLMRDLRNANTQIKDLEEEVIRSDGRIDDLEKDLGEDKNIIASLEEELNMKADELAAEGVQIQQMVQEIQQVTAELSSTKAYVGELEEGAESAMERIQNLEDELASVNDKVQAMIGCEAESQARMKGLEADIEKAQEFARQMEEALEEAEKKMLADEEMIDELQSKLASAERERQRENSMNQGSSHNPSSDMGPADADLEALENELDAANREIARLTTMLSQSPARKAMEKARDTKVELLEREKEELLERNRALRMAMTEINTPSKIINASGISPIHRQVLSMSLRAPKTPGGPLKDISWLNNTSIDPSVSPLIGEINRLQRELDLANNSIDDKLGKLEDAGLGVVDLTKKLEDARSKISVLENEITRLVRREERRHRCLEHARCQKCRVKFKFSSLAQLDESALEATSDDLPTEPPTPPTKTSEMLQANLQSVNSRLVSMKKEWGQERQLLLEEKATLQDATHRLSVQVKTAQEEVKMAAESERAGIQAELEKARKVIIDLETTLKSERAQLRALTTKQNLNQREKAEVLNQLRRTESDMDDVKQQLHKYKKESHDLEAELRENVNAEQKARLLEARVAENAETIEHLRQERALLVADHKQLQSRFSEISEQANRLRHEYNASSTSHDNRRHQLDLQLLEISDLRRALSDQAEVLHKVEVEKDRVSAEKSDVAKTVAALEADLKRVKKDAETFGRDLKVLRAEKEKQEVKYKDEFSRTERTKKHAQAQIRSLNEELERQREKTGLVQEELKNHVCVVDEQVSTIKVQHNKECKGLILQIRYLKAKFTRESSLRSDLAYQKQYLLVLLSRFEKSEQTIFASIARIGFSISLAPPTRKSHKLKSVALVFIFISRATRAGNLWRDQSSSKLAVVAALQDVRRRRAVTPV